ncbi:hypothetical protein ACJROX_09840 [Pseudalkalibacillus sp. A8]|uniref:hypothetical protein n=1 Tax=Pseudalkalibacillus sp. A8 TaxID=3382641 RepID=UPI0038B6128E
MLEAQEGSIPDTVTTAHLNETDDLIDAERALIKGQSVILSEKEPKMFLLNVYLSEFRTIQVKIT